jgi:hypothetical protein
MKYLKEYNSFDLFEPIEDEEVVEYYQSRSEHPKNLEEIVLKSLDSELYDSIQFDFNRHVYGIEDDDFECFQIKLNYRVKRTYYQIILNTFYTDDEYFICGIERFRSKTGEFDFSDDFFDCYVYRCDSIEGLVELIKDLRSW